MGIFSGRFNLHANGPGYRYGGPVAQVLDTIFTGGRQIHQSVTGARHIINGDVKFDRNGNRIHVDGASQSEHYRDPLRDDNRSSRGGDYSDAEDYGLAEQRHAKTGRPQQQGDGGYSPTQTRWQRYDGSVYLEDNVRSGGLVAGSDQDKAEIGEGPVSSPKTTSASPSSQTLEQRAAAFHIDLAGEGGTVTITDAANPSSATFKPAAASSFDVKKLTSDTVLSADELNGLTRNGISMDSAKIGQGPDAPKLLTDKTGKIYGGYTVAEAGNAKHDTTYKFVTREDLEKQFSPEKVAGVESGLQMARAPKDAGIQVAATNAAPAAIDAPAVAASVPKLAKTGMDV